MVDEDLLVDVAKSCIRTCHALKIMAEGGGVDDLSGPSKQIEELERCDNPAQFSLLTMTNGTRTVRHIESAVRKRADCAKDSREDHPVSTTECLMALRTEMLERLRAFDVCGFQLTARMTSQLPQGDLGKGSALKVDEIKHVQRLVNVESSALASVAVCCCFVVSAPCSLLTVCSTQTTSVPTGRDRPSDESSPPVPESAFPDRSFDFVENAAPFLFVDSSDRHSMSESGLSMPPQPGDTAEPSELSLVLDSGERALGRLISGDHPQGEFTSLIKKILSSRKAIDAVGYLGESEAQTFIDVVHGVGYHSPILEEWVS